MSQKKIFLLGVGAQKAGTTWLHSQIDRCDNADFGELKEYHVFDTLFCRSSKSIATKLQNKVLERIKKDEIGSKSGNQLVRRLLFLDNYESYFEYFDYLHYSKKVDLVGDITPAYAALKREAFSIIKKGLEDKGFDVKVVFLMRDPVERIWSSIRMLRRSFDDRGQKLSYRVELRQFNKSYRRQRQSERTLYDKTIAELEAVFDDNALYYGFYECLFDPKYKEYEKITKFLGVNIGEPDFDQKVNATAKNSHIPEKVVRNVVNYYADTYRYIRNRFGDQMTELWPNYRYLDEADPNG